MTDALANGGDMDVSPISPSGIGASDVVLAVRLLLPVRTDGTAGVVGFVRKKDVQLIAPALVAGGGGTSGGLLVDGIISPEEDGIVDPACLRASSSAAAASTPASTVIASVSVFSTLSTKLRVARFELRNLVN